MKRIRILTIAALLIAWVGMPVSGIGQTVSARTADGGGIQWMPYEEGRRRGESENKKILLVFNADWCRYCLQMEQETFRNPTVVAYVNRKFVPISVNSDHQREIAARYQVTGLPSTWFLAENGERIGNRPGYIAADEMLSILKYIGTDSYLTMTYKTFMDQEK